MVKNQDRLRDPKKTFWQTQIICRRGINCRLKKPHHIVTKIPNRPTRKPRIPKRGRRNIAKFLHEHFQLTERISRSFKFLNLSLPNDPNGPTTTLKSHPGLRSHKGVAPRLITLFHRFKKKGVATVVNFLKGGNWRLRVGNQFRVNGDGVPKLRQLTKVGQGRLERRIHCVLGS